MRYLTCIIALVLAATLSGASAENQTTEQQSAEAAKLFDKAADKSAMGALGAVLAQAGSSRQGLFVNNPGSGNKKAPPPPPSTGGSAGLMDAFMPLMMMSSLSALGGLFGLLTGLMNFNPSLLAASAGVLIASVGLFAGLPMLAKMIEDKTPVGGIRGAIGTALKRAALLCLFPLAVLPGVPLALLLGGAAGIGAFISFGILGGILSFIPVIGPVIGAALLILGVAGFGLGVAGYAAWLQAKWALFGQDGNGGLVKAFRENW